MNWNPEWDASFEYKLSWAEDLKFVFGERKEKNYVQIWHFNLKTGMSDKEFVMFSGGKGNINS